MNLDAPSPSGRLLFSSDAAYASVSRLAAAGRAVKLATGLYVVDAALPPAALVTKHLWNIVAHYWPDAVVCDRSALAGGPDDGWLFLSHPDPPRRTDLKLPGLVVTCRQGPGPLPGDMTMPDGVHLSGAARGLVENVVTLGRPPKGRPARAAGTAAVGDRVDALARSGGSGRVRNALAELDVVAGAFDPAAVEQVRQMLAAVLGTVTGGPVLSSRLAARLNGEPYDAHRVELFRGLSATLKRTAPSVRPALGPAERWQWLPFFEAYFSNYIEGTIFSVEEARDIALHDVVPAGRPADAHDVSATYRLVSSREVMTAVPATVEGLLDLLRDRHRVLMAGRPEKNPGEFKVGRNFAGGYEFVHPEQLIGTLRAGFDVLGEQTDPFHRAVLMMFLVSECHPFDDANGRLARVMANAELVARGQVRLVVPNCYRGNYLAALSATSNGAGNGEPLVAALDYTRAWVAAVDWSTWEGALADLEATNATLDSVVAEQTGRRLRLPAAGG